MLIQRLHPLELDELKQKNLKEGLIRCKKAEEEKQEQKSNESLEPIKLKSTRCTFPYRSTMRQDKEEKHEERRKVHRERG